MHKTRPTLICTINILGFRAVAGTLIGRVQKVSVSQGEYQSKPPNDKVCVILASIFAVLQFEPDFF